MSNPLTEIRQAALIVEVPQAEELVGAYRMQHDPSAAIGVPAHITINYPFLPGTAPPGPHLERLHSLFADMPAFEFELSEICRWPDVLYLAPRPVEPFADLIAAVAIAFPDSPPYGGVFQEVNPHLTIAQLDDRAVLDSITEEFTSAARGRLPITSSAREIVLIDNRSGRWATVERFPLRP